MGTPKDATGQADLTYVDAAVDEILSLVALDDSKTLIIKSTVPVETCMRIQKKIDAVGAKIDVVSNPEFCEKEVLLMIS